MSSSLTTLKSQFLSTFQNKIAQARKLLLSANHLWADKVFQDLYLEIEKKDWLDVQKKRQLITVISNSWWMYLNSLIQRKEDGSVKIDLVRYIDAYKRFFSFLSKLEDFYYFNSFSTLLLKTFINLENLSESGISKFINAICVKVKEKGDNLKIIELQLLLVFLRKNVVPTDFYHYSMQLFGKILLKIDPEKRPLFLYVFLENINLNYQLLDVSQDFVQEIVKLLSNRLPNYLKVEFAQLARISINERNYPAIQSELEDLIYYLNNVGEHAWIIPIIRNLYAKIKEYQSFGDAISYIRKFVDFALSRNRFQIAFEIYDFFEDLLVEQTDLGYDNVLIELWVEACKRFVDMKENKYLLQSLEKLNTHLKLPQNINAQLYHYFYTCNYVWQFKSMFFSLESRDFWRMMFYRALFEEMDFDLAGKILPYLEKNLSAQLIDLQTLYKETELLKNQIYSLDGASETKLPPNFLIKQLILRIDAKGTISYRMISLENAILDGTVANEYWNDAQILDLYKEIFSENPEKSYKFSLLDFGKLMFIFLPRQVRAIFKQFKIASLNIIPQIYFILDKMTIPFELIYDSNFFLLKYSIAYNIGDPPLGGVAFDQTTQEELLVKHTKKTFNVLIIDAISSSNPIKWNEESKTKEPIFPFEAGMNEFSFIMNFFNNREEINQINVLSGANNTKENVLLNLSQGPYHIIHFVGNLFYSKLSPKNSFFSTYDNNIVTFNEIRTALYQNNSKIQPFLLFNAQIYNMKGKKKRNTLKPFGEIIAQFDFDRITGIIARNYPLFDEATKQLIANVYINLFNQRSQGVALLKARQEFMAKHMIESGESQPKPNKEERKAIVTSSLFLCGKPWKKLL